MPGECLTVWENIASVWHPDTTSSKKPYIPSSLPPIDPEERCEHCQQGKQTAASSLLLMGQAEKGICMRCLPVQQDQGREDEVKPRWGLQGRCGAPQTCWLQPEPRQDTGCSGGCATGRGFPRRLCMTVEKDGGTLTKAKEEQITLYL